MKLKDKSIIAEKYFKTEISFFKDIHCLSSFWRLLICMEFHFFCSKISLSLNSISMNFLYNFLYDNIISFKMCNSTNICTEQTHPYCDFLTSRNIFLGPKHIIPDLYICHTQNTWMHICILSTSLIFTNMCSLGACSCRHTRVPHTGTNLGNLEYLCGKVKYEDALLENRTTAAAAHRCTWSLSQL